MKNLQTLSIAALFLAFAALACSFSPSGIGSLKTSTDKAGENETIIFKVGDTIHAHAPLVNNSEKVTVKFSLVPEEVKGLTKGESIKEGEVSQIVDGGGEAILTLRTGKNFPVGTYKINADMVNEAGEIKDSKSVNITVTRASE